MNKDRGLMRGLMVIIILLTMALVFSVVYETNSNSLAITQTQNIVLGDAETSVKLDINKCTREEFKSLEGVGDVKADKFIAVRDALGGYQNIYDLTEHGVLGENTFNGVKDRLIVGGAE